MKILLVEDDQSTRTILENTLIDNRYRVEATEDGQTALDLAKNFEYDLMLLDVGIPFLDGISVCQCLRNQGCQIPILLLTARDQASDRVIGLDAGADDYMIKPFNTPELLARIRALLRRGQTVQGDLITWEKLELHRQANEIRYSEKLLRLTPKEYEMLEMFLLHPHRIFSRTAILDRVWELDDPPNESTISSHIKAIRQKLRAAGATQDLIESVYGFGYRLRQLPTVEQEIETEKSPSHHIPDTSSDAAKSLVAKLWEKFKDSFIEQIDLLDQVAVHLSKKTLTEELHEEAKQTAHKLIGSLGIYGFFQGSALAREIDTLLRLGRPLESSEIRHFAHLVSALNLEIHGDPTYPAPSSEKSPAPIAPLPLVLLVDHDQALTNKMKLEAPARSLRVENSHSLLEARAFIYKNKPDLVILENIFLPGNDDGLIWLETLRNDYPELPVLILSSSDSLDDRLKAHRLGVKQFIHKPVTIDQIFYAITNFLPKQEKLDPRVMIVDDDPVTLEHLSELLTPWGLAVTTLAQPERFWEVLNTTQPDLVILDLEMPTISGFDLCQVVRQDIQWQELPILVVTAHKEPDYLQQAFAAGANDFIAKTVMGEEIVTRVLSRIDPARIFAKNKPLL